MKVAYITPYYPPLNKGGAEISLKLLADALAVMGHKIFIFVPNYNKGDEISNDNPKVIRFKFGKDTTFSQTNPLSVNNFAKRIVNFGEDFDLVDAYKWYQPAKIVADKMSIPFICSIRDSAPICDFRVDKNPQEYPIFGYFKKRFSTYGISPRQMINAFYGFFLTRQNLKIISQSDCLTFASAALAKIFKKYNKCGQVVNSVGLPDFRRETIEIDGIDFDKDKIVVYSGRLSNGKGAGFLFETAKEVVVKDKKIKFVFLGDGELINKIYNIKNRQIICLGKKNHDYVLSLIEKATVTVVPSIVFEGFPRIGIESVSLGIPVIGTTVGGVSEAIGEAGILVRPGDKKRLAKTILRVCQDDKLYSELKRQTGSQAEKFKPEKIVKKVISVYKTVL